MYRDLVSYEDDVKWLRSLQSELWPPVKGRDDRFISGEPARRISKDELLKVEQLVVEHDLVTSMCETSMFGKIGMRLYANPIFPGDDKLEPLLLLPEQGLPSLTAFDHLTEDYDPASRAHKPGSSSDYAWELFSRFTHSDENKRRLKFFQLPESRERHYYDY